MANIDYPAVVLEMREFQAGAGMLRSPGSKSGEARISCPPSRRSKAARNAVYICADPLVVTHQVRINTLAPTRGDRGQPRAKVRVAWQPDRPLDSTGR